MARSMWYTVIQDLYQDVKKLVKPRAILDRSWGKKLLSESEKDDFLDRLEAGRPSSEIFDLMMALFFKTGDSGYERFKEVLRDIGVEKPAYSELLAKIEKAENPLQLPEVPQDPPMEVDPPKPQHG